MQMHRSMVVRRRFFVVFGWFVVHGNFWEKVEGSVFFILFGYS